MKRCDALFRLLVNTKFLNSAVEMTRALVSTMLLNMYRPSISFVRTEDRSAARSRQYTWHWH